MSVDVITYFINMFAETLKSDSKGGVLSAHSRFKLEVIVPAISCLALLASGSWIAWSAYEVLVPPKNAEETNPSGDEDVNITVLYVFSSINFFVDLLSLYMFYRKGRSVFGYEPSSAVDLASEAEEEASNGSAAKAVEAAETGPEAVPNSSPSKHADADAGANVNINTKPEKRTKNVNMMSAFLHVGADSIRTFAVFSAAAVASSGQDGAKCDAWAALVCTLTVLFMVFPVAREIHESAGLLLPLMREETRAAQQAADASSQVQLVATSA